MCVFLKLGGEKCGLRLNELSAQSPPDVYCCFISPSDVHSSFSPPTSVHCSPTHFLRRSNAFEMCSGATPCWCGLEFWTGTPVCQQIRMYHLCLMIQYQNFLYHVTWDNCKPQNSCSTNCTEPWKLSKGPERSSSRLKNALHWFHTHPLLPRWNFSTRKKLSSKFWLNIYQGKVFLFVQKVSMRPI